MTKFPAQLAYEALPDLTDDEIDALPEREIDRREKIERAYMQELAAKRADLARRILNTGE